MYDLVLSMVDYYIDCINEYSRLLIFHALYVMCHAPRTCQRYEKCANLSKWTCIWKKWVHSRRRVLNY